jgi:alginate O-acetyltransferase complex protein AlgI
MLRSPKRRKILLLVASYIFYGTWNIPFIGLILLSTSIDYWLSKRIRHSQKLLARKQLLVAGIVMNVIVLAVFKYTNFFIDTTNSLAAIYHLPFCFLQHLNLLLPLGISFYTFEAISYLIDVYRGEPPAESFLDYNFYIMYFPHLISGPIVRYRELSAQMRNGIFLSLDKVKKGCELIILGLAYKLLVADSVCGLADKVFLSPSSASISATYLAWAAFTCQIYFDFMGYTHIARGVSLLFNIELPLNFNHPYNARNISDFWQRWHISLSRWIRDYLFIPLGGSRGTSLHTAINLLLTMTIAGAWHGAGWTFLIWGAYHGVLLLLYHLLSSVRGRLEYFANRKIWTASLYKLSATVSTFLLVAYGWIWFRSCDMSTAMAITGRLSRFRALWNEQASAFLAGDFSFPVTLLMLVLLSTAGPYVVRFYEASFPRLPYWMKAQAATIVYVLCYIFAGAESKPFIYFQF